MNKELTTRSSYMKEKKEALIVLGISIPLLCYGAFSFELGGAGSTVEAISVAVSTTLGLFGVIGGLVLFFTKNSLGLLDSKEPKPIIKEEKEMSEIKKEKPEPIDLGRTTRKSYILNKEPIVEEDTAEQEVAEALNQEKIYKGTVTSEQNYTFDKPIQVSESIGLMKREKELKEECNKLTSLLEEADNELRKTQEKLNHKGWISTEKGWVIE